MQIFRGNCRGIFGGLVGALALIAAGCGGGSSDTLLGDEGKAEIKLPADADEYGAYTHQRSDGKYVDALRVPEEEASWEGRYSMYKAVPLKAQPFVDGGSFNFWVDDTRAIPVRGELFLSIDTEGCAAEDWAIALLHFEGHHGEDDYVQHTMNVSLYQEGTPLWLTKGIKGLSGHGDARGPWKVMFYKKASAAADCALASLRLEIPVFGQDHQKDVASCAEQADDPSYSQFGGHSGDELRISEWEDCLAEANDAALATKDIPREELASVEAYRYAVSSLCEQLLDSSDSFGGSILELYRGDCLKKKERLLAGLIDAYASFEGQETVELPLPELYPLPSPWGNEACYEAYKAAVGDRADEQVKQVALVAHTKCLIEDQFAQCMVSDSSYDQITQCYKEVVLAQRDTILRATLSNYRDHSIEVNEGELESTIDTKLFEAVFNIEDICGTIVAFAGPYDGSSATHGQQIIFDQSYCIQDGLAVLDLEIRTFVGWFNEVE